MIGIIIILVIAGWSIVKIRIRAIRKSPEYRRNHRHLRVWAVSKRKYKGYWVCKFYSCLGHSKKRGYGYMRKRPSGDRVEAMIAGKLLGKHILLEEV